MRVDSSSDPFLSLPPLPTGWSYVPLEDLLESKGLSYGIVQPGADDPRGVPVLRVGNLRNGVISADEPLRVSPEVERSYERTRLRGGEVLLSLVGSVGEVAVVPEQLSGWNVARAVAVLRPIDRRLAKWLALCLQAPLAQRQMHMWKTTTVQATLNLRDVRNLPIVFPPDAEREAIAEVFGALDDKIETNRHVVERCNALAQVLLRPLEPSTPMSTIAEVSRHMVSPSAFLDEPEIDHFSLPAFDNGQIPAIEPGNSIKSGKFVLEHPAVLVSKLNPHIPRVWMAVPSADRLALTSTEFVNLVPKSDCPVEVLWALCSEPSFCSQLLEMVKGTTGSHQRVAPEDVLGIQVADPGELSDPARETVIATVRQTGTFRRESTALATIRDSLLPKLLSGEIRVRDAEDLVSEAV